MLIETDILLAAMNPEDPLNGPARRVIIERREKEDDDLLLLSPFSLLEVNLLARAGKLTITNYGDFARDLGALLSSCSIQTLNDRPEYHSEAHRLESEFKLTFFDSLHAAVSRVRMEIIVSFDKAYDRLGKEGIKRLDPREI